MTPDDELSELRTALDAGTPRPDPATRAAHLRLAQASFDRLHAASRPVHVAPEGPMGRLRRAAVRLLDVLASRAGGTAAAGLAACAFLVLTPAGQGLLDQSRAGSGSDARDEPLVKPATSARPPAPATGVTADTKAPSAPATAPRPAPDLAAAEVALDDTAEPPSAAVAPEPAAPEAAAPKAVQPSASMAFPEPRLTDPLDAQRSAPALADSAPQAAHSATRALPEAAPAPEPEDLAILASPKADAAEMTPEAVAVAPDATAAQPAASDGARGAPTVGPSAQSTAEARPRTDGERAATGAAPDTTAGEPLSALVEEPQPDVAVAADAARPRMDDMIALAPAPDARERSVAPSSPGAGAAPPAVLERQTSASPGPASDPAVPVLPHSAAGPGQVATDASALLDTAGASFAAVRQSLRSGVLPAPEAVQPLALVNRFPPDLPAPEEEPFRPTVSVMATPWNPATRLVAVTIQARRPEDRPPLAESLTLLVEWNPATVAEARLIGQDIQVSQSDGPASAPLDAGALRPGQSLTAIYEVTPRGAATDAVGLGDAQGDLGVLRLLWREPGVEAAHRLEAPVTGREPAGSGARFAAAVAGWGLLLRGERERLGSWTWTDAAALAAANLGADPLGLGAEALDLMRLSERLAR